MYKTACGNGFPLNIPSEINGGGGGASTAESVSYDNTSSGLTAENVQSAIDEMIANFGDGVDEVYNACVSAGSTPVSKSPADIAAAIGSIGGSGKIIELYKGVGSVNSPNISQQFTIPEDGYLFITGYNYTTNSSVTINSGSNVLNVYDKYYFIHYGGGVAVSANDIVSYINSGTNWCYDYISIYLVTGVEPVTP